MNHADTKNFLKVINSGKFGRIVTKSGTQKLYYDFTYNNKRHEKTTGLDFSADNALQARKNLDEVAEKILGGTFSFAEHFPDAHPVALTLHTQKEMRGAAKRPDQLMIRDFIKGTAEFKGWQEEVLRKLPKNQQRSYASVIDFWLLPLYGNMTFTDLTGHALHLSLRLYTFHRKENGKPLSGIRIMNILTPFRMIWNSAVSKYQWGRILEDPFDYLDKNNFGPRRVENPTPALLYDDYCRVRSHLDDYNQRIADIKALTGMIDSEMAGLRKKNLKDNAIKPHIHVCNKIVNGEESEELKTEFRKRKIHLTKRLKKELEYFCSQSPDDYVFTKADGTPFIGEDFRKAWAAAMAAADMEYIRPYCLRHSFAAWSKILGIELSWLQYAMGHSSLEMLFKRYGRHQFGLEDEREMIIEFFGEDYLRIGNASALELFAKAAKGRQLAKKSSHKKAA